VVPGEDDGQVRARRGVIAVAAPFLCRLGCDFLAAPRTLIAAVERVTDGGTMTAITENQTKLRIRPLGSDA
jgi:hypothetical protein